MDERDDRTTRTSGMNTWRAGCGGSCTSGSEGGPGKPTRSKVGRALRSDPYTYVPTWSGVAYVGFIVDAFSRLIVGWRVATTMRTEMVLDALEMARWSRGTALEGLRCHSDAGISIHFNSLRRAAGRDRGGAVHRHASGTRYDNALAEAVNALYKTELIRGPAQGPWRTVEDVELATLGWVHWHNNERLHGYLGDVPPAEFEAAYAAQQTDQELVGIQ